MALTGWLVMAAPTVWAQQKPAPQPQRAQPAPTASQGPLDERIIRLEQRILDLQTVIGTLQTFVRDGGVVPTQGGFPPAGGEGIPGGGIGPGGAPSELSIRVLALETQIKALTTQMGHIASRLDQGIPAAGAPLQQGGLPLPGGQPVPQGQPFGAPVAGGPLGQSQPPLASDPILGRDSQPGLPGFGTSTAGPPAQSPFSDPGPSPQGHAGLQPPPPRFSPPVIPQPAVPQPAIQPLAVSPPVIPGAGGGARAVYDASYESFLRNDFQSAGSGFQRFVKSFPDDQLTSNAYYWLGRTHYARRQYEPAAKAFLSGYKRDKKNPIAPDALLHLGMSLGAMGEKEAACSTLGAISKQFPNAPPTLKQDVGEQLKRTGCKG